MDTEVSLLCRFLLAHGLGHLEPVLAQANVDIDVIGDLSERDLADLGIPLGDRKRFVRAVEAHARDSVQGRGERRQLSVMFADLVDFTSLGQVLDPEQVREAITDYQRVAAQCVRRYDGAVAQYLGDGILAYFGYPRLHEDDAQRAVLAGLALVRDVAQLKAGSRTALSARVGIATGLVVLDSVVQDELVSGRVAIGEAPNRAARLQALGQPGDVLVDESTSRAISHRFVLKVVAPTRLKGFLHALAPSRVLAAVEGAPRFVAHGPLGSQPLVGREAEARQLSDAWAEAEAGRGKALFLRGAAGIGKSRLCAEVLRHAQAAGAWAWVLQCSAHHEGTDHFPLRCFVREAAGCEHHDPTPTAIAAWIGARTGWTGELLSESCHAIGALASTAGDEETVPGARIRSTLVRMLTEAAARQPIILLLEDIHWADPSTLDWLSAIAAKARKCRVLVLATSRELPPAGLQADTLVLQGLTEPAALRMLEHVASGAPLPRHVRQRILHRSAGVPLHLQEITRAVLEGHVPSSLADVSEVPESLQASMAARFDRLGAAREVLQVAAVVGRLFALDPLGQLLRSSVDRVKAQVDTLMAAGLVEPAPQGNYQFCHALIQESAYSTLLISVRRQMHSQLADLLGRGESAGVAESVAWHLTAAGRTAEAVAAWSSVADEAARRGAGREAIHHYDQALDLVRTLPHCDARDREELRQLLKLGPVLMMARGVGTSRSVETYTRAHQLADRIGTAEERFLVAFALWYSYEGQAKVRQRDEFLEALQELARRSADPAHHLQANHALWTSGIGRARFEEVIHAASEGARLFDPRHRGRYIRDFGGHDPLTCCHTHRAAAEWLLGRPADAFGSIERALAAAEASGHVASKIVAAYGASSLYQLAREPERIAPIVQPIIELGKREGVAAGFLSIFVLWAEVMMRPSTGPIEAMRQLLEALLASGARLRNGLFELMTAEAMGMAGLTGDALALVAHAHKSIANAEEIELHPRALMVEGQLHESRGDRAAAGDCLRQAIEAARAQGAISFELAASVRLAALGLHGRESMVGTITELLGRFPPGSRTRDIEDAERLIGHRL